MRYLFYVILLLILFKKNSNKSFLLNSILVFSSYVIIYLVIAPLYSLPYFLTFIPFLLIKKYDNYAHW